MKLFCAFAAIAAAAAANPNLILSHEGLEAGLKLDSNGDINVYAADVDGACVDRRNWCGRYKRDDCTAGAPVKSRLVWRSDNGKVSAAARLHADGKLSFTTSNGGHCIDPMGDSTDAQNPIATGLRLTRSDGVRANVVLDPATGLVMHRATGGTVKVGGETAHPECSCDNGQAHGIGQNSQCQKHKDHHCETCDDGFMLYHKKCVPCPDGFFKNAGTVASHGQQCKAKKTCAAGHIVSAAGSTSQDRTCSPCPSGTYQDQDDSERTACTPQPACDAAGTRYSATATAKRKCVPCLTNFYQPNSYHKVTQCKEQPVCTKGEKMSPDTKTEKRQCHRCEGDTYQDAPQHRETSCIRQPPRCQPWLKLCQVGEEPSPIQKRQCGPVVDCSGPGQYESDPPGFGHGECGKCRSITPCTEDQYIEKPATDIADQECGFKKCTCENGVMAVGAACDTHGEPKCASCNKRFFLDGKTCKPHKDCNAQGKVQTSAGNGLKDAVCGADKKCVCTEGTGATGTDCPVDGDAKCTACSGDFFIDGIACSAHSVDCNAQGKVVATVATNTADATCGAEKKCVCPNGTGATGTKCPADGDAKCMSCNPGFQKEGIKCAKITTTTTTTTTTAPQAALCKVEWRQQSCGPGDSNNNCNWILAVQGGASVSSAGNRASFASAQGVYAIHSSWPSQCTCPAGTKRDWSDWEAKHMLPKTTTWSGSKQSFAYNVYCKSSGAKCGGNGSSGPC